MKRDPTQPRRGSDAQEQGFRDEHQFVLSVEYRGELPELPSELIESLGRLAQTFMFSADEAANQLAAERDAAHDHLVSFFVCLLREVGTGLWRVREKMIETESREPLPEMRRAYRHVEALVDTLAQAGVRIQDHTDEQVPAHGIYALKAVAYEPVSGLACERVIETIKPTIYFGDRIIQVGEVVVGTPLISKRTEDA
jgi:hypothetical protein